MDRQQEIADQLASMALFSDLASSQLRAVADLFDEVAVQDGERILRRGLSGSGFYVILDGEASVVLDNRQIASLPRGDFFGEVSLLLGESPVADVVARRPMRCLVLGPDRFDQFLTTYPRVMYRMLQAQARRLRQTNEWRS